MADALDIAQILSLMSAAFPNFQMKPETPELYLQLLGDIPADELKPAVLQSVSEAGRKFAPSVGEIRGMVSQMRMSVANVPSAYEAWQEVLSEIRSTGSYRRPEFKHPLVERAVETMGWRNLCLSENQVADRARFLQAYEQLVERAAREDMLLPEVRGYIEERGGKLLDAPAEIKKLADGMSK